MTTFREQSTMIKEELVRINAEIEKLTAQREVLLKILNQSEGGPAAPRRRSPNIKPLVLDLMSKAGTSGATSAEVDQAVRLRVPSVAKDTVGSILSRLKADGALTYVGDRYYEKRFTPKPDDPFERLKAVI